MTKTEIEERIAECNIQLSQMQTIINMGNTEVFELIIKNIKVECTKSLEEEDWKALKASIAKINKMRDFSDYIEKQKKLIEEKEEEIDTLQEQLDNYQGNLFEEAEKTKEPVEKEFTGFETPEGEEIFTGDAFMTEDNKVLVVEASDTDPRKFVVLHKETGEELSLNYKKNRELVEKSVWMGNIYEQPELLNA